MTQTLSLCILTDMTVVLCRLLCTRAHLQRMQHGVRPFNPGRLCCQFTSLSALTHHLYQFCQFLCGFPLAQNLPVSLTSFYWLSGRLHQLHFPFHSLGIQTRIFKCRKQEDDSEVAEKNCFSSNKPEPLTKSCNLTACERYGHHLSLPVKIPMTLVQQSPKPDELKNDEN